MIEFVYYLNQDAIEIYKILSKHIEFRENGRSCSNNTVGYFKTRFNLFSFSKKAELGVCTDNIKLSSNIKSKNALFVETFLHEATHATQFCKGKKKNIIPLGVYKTIVQTVYIKKMSSASVSTNQQLSSSRVDPQEDLQTEIEAYYLESEPKKLKSLVKKYCM